MQDGTYDLLHTRTKIVYSFLFYHSYIFCIGKNLFVFSEVTDLRNYNCPDKYELHTLAYELYILCQRYTSGLSKPGSLS